MYENDFEDLTRQLARARENVQGLVQMNDDMSASNARLISERRASKAEAVRLHEDNSDLSSKVRSLRLVADQRDYLFSENQAAQGDE